MDYETKFGKQVLKLTETARQTFKKRFLLLILALMSIASGLVLQISPGLAGNTNNSTVPPSNLEKILTDLFAEDTDFITDSLSNLNNAIFSLKSMLIFFFAAGVVILILRCIAAKRQSFIKKLWYIIPALLSVAAIIMIQGNLGPFENADNLMYLRFFFFGTGSVFILLAIFIKRSSSILYENGFLLARGSKVTEVDFNDLEGILDLKTAHNNLFAGIIKTRQIKIVKKDGEKFGWASTLNSDQFADELVTVFTKYLLRDVTSENINQVNISFGDKLKLTGGQFIYDAGKKKDKISMPLEAVSGVEFLDDEGYWLNLYGQCDENGKADKLAMIRADKTLNSEALYRIIEIDSKETHTQ